MDQLCKVSLLNGYVPALGGRISHSHRRWRPHRTFANETLPPLGSGLDWTVQYNPSSSVLSVVAPLAADYNGNGIVDAADYVLWRISPAYFGGDPVGYEAWHSS